MEKHVDYIHYNPVKLGLTASAATWAYSSFGRYIDDGVHSIDWVGKGDGVGLTRAMVKCVVGIAANPRIRFSLVVSYCQLR